MLLNIPSHQNRESNDVPDKFLYLLFPNTQYSSRLTTKPTKWCVRPAKTQLSLGIRPVWSESSLCAHWVAKDPSFLHADSEDSDQIRRMLGWSESSLGAHAILLVLPWGGLNAKLRCATMHTPTFEEDLSFMFYNWASSRENLSSGFAIRVDSNRPAQLQELISDIETRGIILSMKRTTKVLIRLRRCAGWSAPLLFAYGLNRFPRYVAHMWFL